MAERRFTVRLDAEMNISQVKSAVQTMQTELSKLNLPQDVGSKLTGTFDKLTGEIEKFQAMSAKGIGSSKDFTQLERSGDKILQLYAQLRNQVQGLGGLSDSQLSKMVPPSALSNIKKASDAFKTYKAEIERSQGAIQKQQGAISSLQGEISGLEKEMSRVSGMDIVGSTSELNKMGKDVAAAKNELDGLEQEATQVKDKMAQMESTMASPRKSSKYRDLQAQLEGLGPKIEQARNNYQNLQTQFANTTTVQKQITQLKTLGGDLETARSRMNTLTQELQNMQATDGSQALLNLVNALNQIPGINIDPTTASLEQIQQVINNLASGEINQLKTTFAQVGGQVNSAKGQFDQFGQKIDETRGKVKQMDSQMGEVDMLKSRISYFFGLTNSVYLLRRALTSALETVKELDKTMTEAAVVTDFSVDDMWDKLPKYTAEASKLGATVNDLYSATTLYYQQGLKTNEAMALGTETMKMARIAGMDASEATEAMTAALRGFNMELNETSATRVNDVYSQLAAVTAADTEQIATAMTKTASIAHSANMEFETTAALLAQIIETTQEAPETAGTAMKTIIARFSEVKELKSQGKTKGEDEEGEEIDVNKIQTALRTVGISMDDFFAGTEGLGSVLLRLAEKWDSLDFETQRYIATMAAGSRQQSRFIAMMSDYERTMELVGEANNSTGASQKQFEKTLDSLEAKLNKLKNEWDRFAMGIADNELIKMGIDLLTGVLKIINDLTDGISGENGLLKSVINLGVAFGGLKLGGLALTKGLGFFLGMGGGKENLNNGVEHKKRMSDADAEHKKRQMQADVEHKQKMANLAKENAAAIGGEVKETTAAVTGEKVETTEKLKNEQITTIAELDAITAKKAAALEAEYTEKLAGIDAEETEKIASLNGEYAEKVKSLEGEYLESASAITGEKVEEVAAVSGETAELMASLKGKMTGSGGGIGNFFKKVGSGIGGFFKKNGKMIGSIAGIVAAVAIIGAAANGFEKAIDEAAFTSEERMKSLQTVEEGLTQQTNEMADALAELGSKRSNLTQLVDSLKTLKRGSADWASSLHKARQEMTEILDTYPELKQYTETINGVAILTDEGWAKYEELLTNSYNASMMALYGVKMQQNEVEKIASAEVLVPTTSITATEQEKLSSSTKTGTIIGGAAGAVGGWIVGSAVGAKIGTAIGTAIAPGVGTAIGAVLGIALGALGGWLFGGGTSVSQGFDAESFNLAAEAAGEYKNSDGTLFSAQSASDEQIKQYAEDMAKKFDIDAEDLEEYILNNKEEFDQHTQHLIEANQRLIEFGESLGYITAQNEGYDEENSNNLALITGAISKDSYNDVYNQIRAQYTDRELTNEERKRGAELIGKNYTYENDKYIDTTSRQEVEITDDNVKDALAASETGKIIGEMATQQFEFIRSITKTQKEITVASTLISGKNIRGLSYNELFGKNNVIGYDAEKGTYGKEGSLYDAYRDGFNALGHDLGLDVLTEITGMPSYTLTGQNAGAMKWRGKDQYTSLYPTQEEMAWYLTQKGYDVGGKASYTWIPYSGSGKAQERTKTFEQIFKQYGEDMNMTSFFNGFEVPMQYIGGDWKEISPKEDDNKTGTKYGYTEDVKIVFDEDLFYNAISKEFGVSKEIAETYYAGNTTASEYFNLEEVKAIQKELEPIIEKFPFLAEVSMANAKSFTDQINRLVQATKLTEEQATKLIYNPLNDIFDKVGNLDSAYAIMSRAAMLDFTNLGELEQFKSWMKTLPGVNEDVIETFDGTIEGLEELGIAFARVDLESVIEQLENLNKMISKLNKLKYDETPIFSEEEMQTILQGGGNREDFFATTDGYVYLGESIEDLRDTLVETNKILLDQQLDALKTKLGMADDIRDAGLTDMSWGTVSSWGRQQYSNMVKTGADNLGITVSYDTTTGTYTATRKDENGKEIKGQDALKGTIYENMDVDTFGRLYKGVSISELAFEGIKQIGEEWADAWLNQSSYASQYKTGAQTQKEQFLSGLDINELLAMETDTFVSDRYAAGSIVTFKTEDDKTKTGTIQSDGSVMVYEEKKDENGDTVYQTNADGTFKTDESGQKIPVMVSSTYKNVVQQQDGTWKETDEGKLVSGYSETDINNAIESKLISQNLTGYRDYLVDTMQLSKEMAARIVLSNQEMGEGVSLLSAGYADWAKSIELGPASPKYHQALAGLRNSAEKLLGSTENLSDEWLANEKNMALFKRAAEGDMKAIEELRKSAAKEIGLRLGMDESSAKQVSDAVSDFIDSAEYGNLKIGAQLDDTTLGASLEQMLKDGKITVEQMNGILSGIGWTPEITYAEVPVDQASSYLQHTNQQVVNPATGEIETVTAENIGSFAQDGVVKMPIIGNAAPNFSGFNIKTNANFNGQGNSIASSPGGGGGGGSKYENPYDKYHNTLEEINDLLRERERLERRYQRLLDRGTASAYELKEISQTTVTNLEQEIARHKIVQQGRREQIAELVAANESKLGKYVQAEKLENGEYSIRIDWDLIEGVKNSKTGESIDEFYDELKEYMESDYDMQNEILDKEDEIFDKLQEGKDEYLDLEDQVKEAIIQSKQEQINELSNINDSINDANSNILDSMQKQIDDARQARENEKTEEELSDKQRRLAYLQQDTSGANALEILNLQKEIEEGQESYTDQLIDQKISELQEQNDLAAEQRQRQIDILQAQLDEYSESSRIWQDVANLIVGGTDEKGGLIAGSDLDQLLKSAESFEGMSKIQQMDWMKETNNLIASALTWLSEGAVSTFKTGQQIQFTDADGNTQTGIADVNGNVKTENGVYENVSWNAREGKYTTDESTEEKIAKKKAEEEAANSLEAKIKEKFPYGRPSEIQRNLSKGATGDDVKALQKALNDLGFSTGGENGTFGSKTWSALGKFKDKYGGHGEYGFQANTRAAFRKIEEDGIHYKTGGLADFTGPAWLDGTKSRPEYILNADQTKAFFNLVDVLSSLQTGSGKTVENSGDKSYDIDINVESIGSDYDVEQLADVVKRLINEDARYRNNNAINLMR